MPHASGPSTLNHHRLPGGPSRLAALLIAPWLLRRFGTIPGLSLMQGTTALALASLASGVSGWIAAAAYTTYVASQYMT